MFLYLFRYLREGYSPEVTCASVSWGEPPRGRTVRQRLRRRRWLSLGVLRIWCSHSIAPGCYTVFSPLLILCYFRRDYGSISPTRKPRNLRLRGPQGSLAVGPQLRPRENAYLFFRNFLGRTTQRTNRPIKAPAAIMAIISRVPLRLMLAEYHICTSIASLIDVKSLLRIPPEFRQPMAANTPVIADPVRPSAMSPRVSVYAVSSSGELRMNA